jgi:hypothetical protein
MTFIKRLALCFFLSGAVLLMQGCTENDPGPKEALLTVNIEAGYFTGLDVWLFISDEDGKTIDVRQAKDSTRIKFSGAPQATVALTIFTQVATTNGDGSTWNGFGFSTYQQIAAGSTIELKRGTSNYTNQPDVIGTASFTLNNYDDSDNPEQALFFTDGISIPYSVLDYSSYSYTGTDFKSQLNVREDPAHILIATYQDDIPVYQWLNDVKPGDEIKVDFDSFDPSKTIAVNKQVAFAEVKTMIGASFATGYIFCNLYSRQISKSSNPSEPPKLGYLDGFDKYFVYVILDNFNEPSNLYYSKAGTIPQAIHLPDYKYSVNDDNLYTLSLDFSNDYSYKSAYFIKAVPESQVTWQLFTSETKNFKAPAIPAEIRKVYPALNVNDLTLQFAAYTHALDGYTYVDYLRDVFASVRRIEYEELRYVVAP